MCISNFAHWLLPFKKEGKIMWKGTLVPWQQFGGGFYTWEKGQAFWHSNS